MRGSKSNLISLREDVTNDTSDLSEMKISDEKGSVEKRTMTLIGKKGYHDSVYKNAAKIFQSIRTEKRKDRILVRYGDGSASPMLTFKDQYSQRVSYELAFSALKCKYKTFPRIANRNGAAEKIWGKRKVFSFCLTAEIWGGFFVKLQVIARLLVSLKYLNISKCC